MTARAAVVEPCRACEMQGDPRAIFCFGVALGMSSGATFEVCAKHRHVIGEEIARLARVDARAEGGGDHE
jgi:hypothetical protein